MATELELKLRLAPQHLKLLLQHPPLKRLCRGRPVTRRLHSIYYDTPDLSLWRNGYALRVRRAGGRWVQTLKGEGAMAAGLHQRQEWEAEVSASTPDLTKISDPALAKLFSSQAVRDGLRPVFVTEFRRTTRILGFPDGSEAELAMDRGEVAAGENRQTLCEIELELTSGNPARLFELAQELQKTIPFALEPVSKAERGYRLAGAEPPAPMKASSPALTPGISIDDGFKAIAWNCIGQLHGNEAGLIEGPDPEYLHQMRVGLRRLRSALGIFSAVYGKPALAPVRDELKWLATQLGPARDWDVFVTQLLPALLAQFSDHAGLAALRDEAQALRAKHSAEVREAVQSARYRALLLTLGAWLYAEPWRSQSDPAVLAGLDAPLATFAAAVLEKRQGRLRKQGRRLARLTAEERHVLRIAAKKLRYAAEFFAPLYPRARPFLRALSRLQDVLGALNDAATARRLLEELSGRNGANQEAVGLVLGWVARAADDALLDLKRAWDRFCDAEPFWKDRT